MYLAERIINVTKRSTCVKKNKDNKWVIDKNIPIFKGEGREYIEELI